MKEQNDLVAFSELQRAIADHVAPIKSLQVTSLETSKIATDAYRVLSGYKKDVEAKRVERVSPHNNHVKQINDFAKQVLTPVIEAMDFIKEKQVAYERVLEKEREILRAAERDERRKREEELQIELNRQRDVAESAAKAIKDEAEVAAMFDEASKEDAGDKAKDAIQAILTQQAIESTRLQFEAQQKNWDNSKEIKDVKVQGVRRSWKAEVIDESLIPHMYLSVDQVKINVAVRAGARDIPGVRIYEDMTITGR